MVCLALATAAWFCPTESRYCLLVGTCAHASALVHYPLISFCNENHCSSFVHKCSKTNSFPIIEFFSFQIDPENNISMAPLTFPPAASNARMFLAASQNPISLSC